MATFSEITRTDGTVLTATADGVQVLYTDGTTGYWSTEDVRIRLQWLTEEIARLQAEWVEVQALVDEIAQVTG